MTDQQYVLGFILMAVVIAVVLGIGTLVMAGVLHRPHREGATAEKQRSRPHVGEHRHHWYDRFHHAT